MAATVLQIGSFSDADTSKRPVADNYCICNADVYQQKLGALWAKARAQRGDSSISPNQKYVLDRLPQGYVVYERSRPSNPAHKDRYLFGHPRGGTFDSPNRFFPHFTWLMSHGANAKTLETCKCIHCDRGSKAPRGLKAKDRAPATKLPEGNGHTWQMLLKKLEKNGVLDEDIKDSENMELAISQQTLDDSFAEMRISPSYRHRVGELVLFANPDRVPTKTNPTTQQQSLIYEWKAGVISLQNDDEQEPVVEEDLFYEKQKRWAITYSGFKVEFYPDPRAQEPREWSKHMTYVPLHRIRPFNYWEEVLANTPKEKWHPTVYHAMSVLSSISVLDCFHIKGVWPFFATSCRSVWIGAELICIGDAVRLKPKDQHDHRITDVLVVESITVLGENCGRSKFPYKLHLAGSTFTTNANHKDDGFQKRRVSEQILYTRLPRSMFGRHWYYLHEAEDKSVVSVDCVIGRMHGDVAMAAWFDKPGNFDIGLRGLLEGRKYSRTCYGYEEACWYWAETRAQQLELKEINEVYVGKGPGAVQPGGAREHMKVLNSHGADSSALDGSLVDSLPDSQEHLRGVLGRASARAVLGGRSRGGFIPKKTFENTQPGEGVSRESENSSEELEGLTRDIAEGGGLPGDESRVQEGSDGDGSENDELSTPNVKRLKIEHH